MHVGVAAPAFAVDDLLIREHRTAGIAPVDAGLLLIGQAALVEELEEPLRPLIVFGLAGHNLAIPVVGEAHGFLLALHIRNIGERPVRRLDTVFDGCVLSWHAEGVKTHRMQDVEAFHGLVTGHDVADGVVTHVAHVQIARGIREHLQRVILRPLRVRLRLVDGLLLPLLLPFLLDCLRVVPLHTSSS